MSMSAPVLQRTLLDAGGVVALALAAAGFWLLRNFDPNTAINPFPPCMFKTLTGFYCIGCGATRAMHALVHGDLASAMAMNPLLVLVIPVVPVQIAWSLGWRPDRLRPLMQRLLLAPKFWLVLLLGYWVLRNLPWWPFSWLAPG